MHEPDKFFIVIDMFFLKQVGLSSLVIGGVRFLDDFSSESVTLRVEGANVIIEGEKLEISYFSVNEIQIVGTILKISMEKKSGFFAPQQLPM